MAVIASYYGAGVVVLAGLHVLALMPSKAQQPEPAKLALVSDGSLGAAQSWLCGNGRMDEGSGLGRRRKRVRCVQVSLHSSTFCALRVPVAAVAVGTDRSE